MLFIRIPGATLGDGDPVIPGRQVDLRHVLADIVTRIVATRVAVKKVPDFDTISGLGGLQYRDVVYI